MKKLIIAIGAVIAAVAANAAAIDWNIEYAYDPIADDDMDAGYYAFVIADTGTGASKTFSRDLALEALAVGDVSFVDTYALADGAEFAYGEAKQFGVGSFDMNQTVKAYAVILDADNVNDATKAFITELGETYITGMNGGAPIKFGDISDETSDTSNWYAATAGGSGGGDVPEPTSGLLLMLGVAGLALRRKVK